MCVFLSLMTTTKRAFKGTELHRGLWHWGIPIVYIWFFQYVSNGLKRSLVCPSRQVLLTLELSCFLLIQLAIPIENGSLYDLRFLWRAFFFSPLLACFKPINLLLDLVLKSGQKQNHFSYHMMFYILFVK